MAGDGIILIDLTLADFWLQRLHIDYRPLNRQVCSLYRSCPPGPWDLIRIIPPDYLYQKPHCSHCPLGTD